MYESHIRKELEKTYEVRIQEREKMLFEIRENLDKE